jgi:glutaminase
VLARVGVEPSGDAYNSLMVDERHHRPYNPMVNAGALVAARLKHQPS